MAGSPALQAGIDRGENARGCEVLFCFHTHDREISLAIASLSATLRSRAISTGLVIFRQRRAGGRARHPAFGGTTHPCGETRRGRGFGAEHGLGSDARASGRGSAAF